MRPGTGRLTCQSKNSENNRPFFEFDLKTLEFCPKYANFALRQGNNREFCGFLHKCIISKVVSAACGRIQKNNRDRSGSFRGYADVFARGVTPTAAAMAATLFSTSPGMKGKTATARIVEAGLWNRVASQRAPEAK